MGAVWGAGVLPLLHAGEGDVQGGGRLFQYVQRPLNLLGPVLADDAEPEPGPVLGHGGKHCRGNEHAYAPDGTAAFAGRCGVLPPLGRYRLVEPIPGGRVLGIFGGAIGRLQRRYGFRRSGRKGSS